MGKSVRFLRDTGIPVYRIGLLHFVGQHTDLDLNLNVCNIGNYYQRVRAT
jgi:hypothetical protein